MKASWYRALVLTFLAAFALSLQAAPKPHIILFVSDDMGWNEVGYHGSKIATPHIDGLAKEGVQLDRFYVHPICSPTRAALMTGRSPARFGITAALTRGASVPMDEHFMPQTFQKAGYQTFLVGKWHLGATGPEYKPNAGGLTTFLASTVEGLTTSPEVVCVPEVGIATFSRRLWKAIPLIFSLLRQSN